MVQRATACSFFRREVFVQAGFGNAHLGGHFVHCHRVEAFVGEQAIDRAHDGVFARFKHLLPERNFDHGRILSNKVSFHTYQSNTYRQVCFYTD
jgi:hypothetical protein